MVVRNSENALRKIWQSGKCSVNGWIGIPSGIVAEAMAQAGWDSLTVDVQHGMQDVTSLVDCLQGIETTDTVPLVRVPWLEPGILMKTLDAGSRGIICPMVNTRAQAESLVQFCRYPPQGERSYGPMRATWRMGADYVEHANREILLLPMIETAQAMANLDDILSTPGLDGCYIGPADLSLSHGYKPGMDREEKDIVDMINRIRDVAHKNGLAAGIHCGSTEYACRMAESGFQMVTIQGDHRLLILAAEQAVQQTRKGSKVAP